MNRLVSLLLCLCLTLFSAPVWAEGNIAVPSLPVWSLAQAQAGGGEPIRDPAQPRSTAEEELEDRIRELRVQQADVNVRSPRKARLAGGILLGVGAGIAVLAAVSCAAANSGSGTECREANATGLEIGGGAVAAIGLVTLITGISTLKAREAEVDEYDRKIKALNQQRSQKALPIDAHLSLGEEKKLTLSWRF